MKALTICQPYAELIARGVKLVENRTWTTSYRGPLAIHAGLSKSWLDLDPDEPGLDVTYEIPLAEMSFGAIVAVADLVQVFRVDSIRTIAVPRPWQWLREHEHTEGPYCWVLQQIRRIEPIPARGAMGL